MKLRQVESPFGLEMKRNQNAARRAARLFHRVCVVCGTEHALQIAHIDRNRANNDPDNLAYLCATHHAMQDVGLYADDVIKALRHDWDQHKGQPDHALRMKDAGRKAAATRLRNRTLQDPVLEAMYE